MSATALAAEKIHYDKDGNPAEVVIPYAQFLEMTDKIERNLLDFDAEEIRELEEALEDSRSGNRAAFTPLSEL